jgi:hypothetical protein
MNENRDSRSGKRLSYSGLGMAVGLLFGGILGLITGNIPLFAGGGMVVGLAIGSAAHRTHGSTQD